MIFFGGHMYLVTAERDEERKPPQDYEPYYDTTMEGLR